MPQAKKSARSSSGSRQRSKTEVRHKIGSDVMAKWPGSTLYFKARIMDVMKGEYEVKFEDGTDYIVPSKYIFDEKRFTRSRSKSPSRPKRKSSQSPGRPKKTAVEKPTETVASRIPPRQRKTATISPVRLSARIQAKAQEIEKEEDEEEEATKKPVFIPDVPIADSAPRKTKEREFGGVLGALLFSFLIPAIPFWFTRSCTRKSCALLRIPEMPRTVDAYLDPTAAAIYMGFVFVQLILSFIPIGKLVDTQPSKQDKFQYRCNGFLALLLTLASIPGLLYLKVPVLSVASMTLRLLVTALLFGFLIAVLLYIKARKAPISALNARGNTGSFFYDFFVGRELCPRFFNRIDVKAMLWRLCLFTWAILIVIHVVKDIQNRNGVYSPTILVAAVFQLFYVMDAVWFEDNMLTMFEYTGEGVGWMTCAGYTTVPFVYLFTIRYLLLHRVELPWYYLVPIASLNLIGYIILRGSNSQKNEYRKNPLNPALAHLETIPTSKGKKLLVSGWWGIVRHPNYLGDSLVQLSWALPCGFNHALPWAIPILSILSLFQRAGRVDHICKKKYGSAWARYCERVPCKMIPKIF